MSDTPKPAPPPFPQDVLRGIWFVIPAYNEASRVGEVVRDVRGVYSNVVVVDDGSKDATGDVALAAGAVVLRHGVNRGQGAALQTAIAFALNQNAQYVVTFDSDGQHLVDDVAAMLSPLIQGRWHISLGSRFLGHAENISFTRRCMLKGAVLFTRLVSRVRVTDAHNGLRAFTREAAEKIDITLDRMAHASELIDQIREMDLPYGEVPVHIRYTEYSLAKGQGSLAAGKILFHYFFKRLTS